MTTEQKQMRAVINESWKRAGVPLKVEDFSFEIHYYANEVDMYYHRYSELKDLWTFPSVRAAVHYMNVYHPEIILYDVEVVYAPAKCPQPFILEL